MLRYALFLAAASCALPSSAAFVTFSATGPNPAAIQGTVDAYRAALGTLNPNVAGSFGTGRREINWDGVPDQFSALSNLPVNFFNKMINRHRFHSYRTKSEYCRESHDYRKDNYDTCI